MGLVPATPGPCDTEMLFRPALSDIASDDAMFFADTGTAVIWLARHVRGGRNRGLFGSFSWASMANAAPNAFGAQLAYPGRQTIALCGDGGFTMLGLGDLLTQVGRKTPVVQIILNNEAFDFVKIEQQESGFIPFGVDFQNSTNFARVAEPGLPKRWARKESGSKSQATSGRGLPRPSLTRTVPWWWTWSWIHLLSPFHLTPPFMR